MALMPMLIRIWIRPSMLENQIFFFTFIQSIQSLPYIFLFFLVSVIDVIIFSVLDSSILKFSGKSIVNQTLSLHLVVYGYKSGSGKMMPIQPDPDAQN
jgi:hypothetical protein